MKPILVLLLAASIAANAWLLLDSDNAANQVTAASTDQTSSSPNGAPALSPELWTLVQSGGTSSAKRLRALGLPEHIVRALIREEVNKRYREREKALYTRAESRYWMFGYSPYLHFPSDSAAALDLNREKEAELKRLLGDDWYDDRHEWFDRRYGFLSPEKRTQLRLIEEDYDALETQERRLPVIRLPGEREKQRFLQEQKRADIVALLTPEELEQYDLRHSSTSRSLVWNLAYFEPTEAEFKAIYALHKSVDDQYPDSGSLTPELVRARNGARRQLDPQIKEVLGEERYAEYKRSQDSDYGLLRQLNVRLDVPIANVTEAYELKNSLEKRLREFQPTPGSDAKQERLEFQKTLTAQAEAEFTRLLGEKGFSATRGRLLRRIQPLTTNNNETGVSPGAGAFRLR
jgi:hypothetical protein